MRSINRMMYGSTLPILLMATSQAMAETYSFTTAKGYATSNYSTPYTKAFWEFWVTPNPFPDLGQQSSGGNCTNFASQSILVGLTGKTSPVEVYNQRNSFLVDRNEQQSWYLTCNDPKVGSGYANCRSFSWGLVANLRLYADNSIDKTATKKGLRFQLITKTTRSGTTLLPLDYTKVKEGDIIFADFNYNYNAASNPLDHTMIVTGKKPLQAKNPSSPTTVEKYNTIRLTYQTSNKTDRGLGDIHSESMPYSNPSPAFYVYRPIDYKR